MPVLTAEDRRAASAKAVAARRTRAEVGLALKHGQIGLDAVLARAEQDEALAGMRVLSLIEALPRYGKVRAAQTLERLHIAASRRVRGLGPNQRADLIALHPTVRRRADPTRPDADPTHSENQ